jgi:ABC-type sugar transport system ATPase subunit
MAAEEIRNVSQAYPMKGGDGPDSYAKNSTYQVLLKLLYSFMGSSGCMKST